MNAWMSTAVRSVEGLGQPRTTRILFVEDDPSEAALVTEELAQDPRLAAEVVCVSALAEALRQLDESKFDIGLIDLELPDSRGLAMLDRLREAAPDLPIVVLSGHGSDTLAVEVLRRGAQEFLSRGRSAESMVPGTIHRAIERQMYARELGRRARQLSESEARFRTIVDASVDAMLIIEAGGRIVFANPVAARMLGQSGEALVGTQLGFPIVDGQVTEVDVFHRGERPGTAEMRVVRIPWGEETMLLALLRDITERKRAEAAISEANSILESRVIERTADLELANRELEAFSSSVSHDLRGPLLVMDANLVELESESAMQLDEGARACLRNMDAACRRMRELIEDMLYLARLSREPLARCRLNLTELASDVMQTLHVRHPGRKVTFVAAPTPPAAADPRLMRIVMENLLGNALKYTARTHGARIEFGCDPGSRGAPPLYFVRDNGAGFDMSKAAGLFQPFKRLHRADEFEGTGVGLATVKRIIDRHRGAIVATGAVGGGATFHFSLEPGRRVTVPE